MLWLTVPSLLSCWGYVQLFGLLSHPKSFLLPDRRGTARSILLRSIAPSATVWGWNLAFWLWWMADGWALYEYMCVSTQSKCLLELAKYLLFFPLTVHHKGCFWPPIQHRSSIFCFCRVPTLCWGGGMNHGQFALGLIQISIALLTSEKQCSWLSQISWCVWELLSFLSSKWQSACLT